MTRISSTVATFVIAAAASGWAATASAQNIVICESDDGRYKMCRTDTRGGVSLQQQFSRTDCVYNRTWGYDRSGVWVSDGCRAKFEIGNPGWHDSSSGSWSGGTGQTITCESLNAHRNHCRVNTYQGVRLDHQLSRAPCQYGRDWGYDNQGIWVDNGCRAEFELGHSSHGGGHPGHSSYHPQSGGTSDTVLCESKNYDRNYCPAHTMGGVRLQQQMSQKSDCVFNDTWGYDSGGIWVSGGCRALFQLGEVGHTTSRHDDHNAEKIAAAALVVGAIAAIAASDHHDGKGRDADNQWH